MKKHFYLIYLIIIVPVIGATLQINFGVKSVFNELYGIHYLSASWSIYIVLVIATLKWINRAQRFWQESIPIFFIIYSISYLTSYSYIDHIQAALNGYKTQPWNFKIVFFLGLLATLTPLLIILSSLFVKLKSK